MMDEDYFKTVVCSNSDCDNSIEVPATMDISEDWKCNECRGKETSYTNPILNWLDQELRDRYGIEKQIYDTDSLDTSEEEKLIPPGLFVFRELVQNADDADAEMMTLVFKDEEMRFYNDGKRFSQDDFDGLGEILSRRKELDPDTTGTFGSGFQTVYYFTEKVKVHSHRNSMEYNPIEENEDERVKSLSDEDYLSPPWEHLREGERTGSVFCFPWRREENKSGRFEGEYFNSWPKDKKRYVFEEYIDYAHDVLICCNNLKTIRFIWDIDDRTESYQVQRDFKLDYVDNDEEVVKIKEGRGFSENNLDDWGRDFGEPEKDWVYEESEEYEYFLGSDFITDSVGPVEDKEEMLFITKGEGGTELKIDTIGKIPGKEREDKEDYDWLKSKSEAIKKSELHLLLPMFDVDSRKSPMNNPPCYISMPLAFPSNNNFVISVPLFSTEKRDQLEIHSDIKEEWLYHVIRNTVSLFNRFFPRYVKELKDRFLDGKENPTDDDMMEVEDIILKNLPTKNIEDWIGVRNVEVPEDVGTLQESLFNTFFSEPIIHSDDRWLSIFDDKSKNLFYPKNDELKEIFELMGVEVLGESFLNHPRIAEESDGFISDLKEKVEAEDENLIKLYYGEEEISEDSYLYGYLGEDGDLIYDEEDEGLKKVLRKMKRYWVNDGDERKDFQNIPIIPTKDHVIKDYEGIRKEPKKGHESLIELLPDDLTPLSDFATEELLDILKPLESDREGVGELIRGIDEKKGMIEDWRAEKKIRLLIKTYDWMKGTGVQIRGQEADGYDFILNHDYNLISKEESRWMPYEHYEELRGILYNSDMDKSDLINQEILESLSPYFGRLDKSEKDNPPGCSCKIFDYPELIKSADEDIKEGDIEGDVWIALIEGLIKGSKSQKSDWDMDDLKGLGFLPSNGRLVGPSEGCFGFHEDEDIQNFLGIIDKSVQDRLREKGLKEDLSKDLDIDDLDDEEEIEHIVDRLERFYKNQEDESFGMYKISDDEHRIISKCIKILSENEELTYERVEGKPILPVRYGESSYVEKIPEEVDTGQRQAEDLERIDPYLSPRNEDFVHEAILLSTKIVDIHQDIRLDSIPDEFRLMNLTENNQPGRQFMMNFVVPDDRKSGNSEHGPLFHEEELEEFLLEDFRTEETFREIKDSFLPPLLKRYEEDREEGEGRKYYEQGDYKSWDVRLIPPEVTNSESWVKPEDILLDIGMKRGVLEYKTVDIDRFHDLYDGIDDVEIENALWNLGAHKKVNFEKLLDGIDELIDSDTPDKQEKLIDLFLLTVKNEIGKKKKWESGIIGEWVPTKDGVSKINEVIIPTKKIENVLRGRELNRLLDDGYIGDKEKDELFSEPKDWSKLMFITDIDGLSDEELIYLYNEDCEEGVSPPKELSEAIQRRANEFDEDELKEMDYHSEEKGWVDPKDVVILDREDEDKEIPSLLDERYTVLTDVDDKDLLLNLRESRGLEKLDPILSWKDVLSSLESCEEDRKASGLWSFAIDKLPSDEFKEEIDSARWEEKSIYPSKGQKYRPSRILLNLDRGRDLSYTGPFDGWLSLEITKQENHIKEKEILSDLGAKSLGELIDEKTPLIYDIIEALIKEYEKTEGGEEKSDELLDDIKNYLTTYFASRNKDISERSFVPIIGAGDKHHFSPPEDIILISDIPANIKKDLSIKEVDELKVPEYGFFEDIEKKEIDRWLKNSGANRVEIDDDISIEGKPDETEEVNIGIDKALIHDKLSKELKTELRDNLRGGVEDEIFESIIEKIEKISQLETECVEQFNISYDLSLKRFGHDTVISDSVKERYMIEEEKNKIWISGKVDVDFFRVLKDVYKHELFKEVSPNLLAKNMIRLIFHYLPYSPEEFLDTTIEPEVEKSDERLKTYMQALERWWSSYIEDDGLKELLVFSGDDIWPHIDIWGDGITSIEERDRKIRDTLEGSYDEEARELFFRILAVLTFFSPVDNVDKAKEFLEHEIDLGEVYHDNPGESIERQLKDWTDKEKTNFELYPRLKRRYMDVLAIRNIFEDDYRGSNILDRIMNNLVNKDPEDMFQFLRNGKASNIRGTEPLMRGFRGSFTRNIYLIVREFHRLGLSTRWEDGAFHLSTDTKRLLKRLGQSIDESREDWRGPFAKKIRSKLKDFEKLYEYHDLPFQAYATEKCDDCPFNYGEICYPTMREDCIFGEES